MPPSSSPYSSEASQSPSSSLIRKRKHALESETPSADSAIDAEPDEPILSHAAKRKQKRKDGKNLPEADDTVPVSKKPRRSPEATGDVSALPSADHIKRQNSIWVGNLSFKTTSNGLVRFFDGIGDITRVHMPTKMVSGRPDEGHARKENRGFAYVDFRTPNAKTVAISMSEQFLDGRKLLIKDGNDFTGRPIPAKGMHSAVDGVLSSAPATGGLTKSAKKILANQKQPPAPSLFFGNLGFDATEDSIRKLLEAHGKKASHEDEEDSAWIRKVRMGTFEDSGKCKGWAFVDFTSIKYATAALTNPRNHHLNGRNLVVEYASPEAVRRGGGGGERRSLGRKAVADREEDGLMEEEPLHEVYSGKPAKERKGRSKHSRPTPGAALALAKREQIAIVPSQGTRITFD
ncbi:hypothetical protein K488DRAFT_81776 [Vararia minispora EC-137]|uniref:Uncharacterized protein n=1 Tax=Vararia minispora EC-137 TaxID=1314806 RepID=A0ACB8QZ06_9AGAM|nr:hypothetical protein K488DRAFT_81776 [Vararia minispora EC-137]